jgi:hypothetical protein
MADAQYLAGDEFSEETGMRVPIAASTGGLLLVTVLILSGCAGYGGHALQPGLTTLDEVLASMGQPALRWQDPDGRVQLAYPRGPAGPHTFMVFLAPDGRLEKIENVLVTRHFARIVAGKSDQAAVLRVLGPPVPAWTAYFKARDELVWEWPFCDDYNLLARFSVLFDNATGIVRTTQQRQDLRGREGIAPYCAKAE